MLFEDETYNIIGACMKVHRKMGTGFLEAVYQEVLEKEFDAQKIPFQRQVKLKLFYEGKPLKKYFVADFVCFDEIILEIKSAVFLHKNTEAQTINYLKSTNKQVGLLINFGKKSLVWKRFVNTH